MAHTRQRSSNDAVPLLLLRSDGSLFGSNCFPFMGRICLSLSLLFLFVCFLFFVDVLLPLSACAVSLPLRWIRVPRI